MKTELFCNFFPILPEILIATTSLFLIVINLLCKEVSDKWIYRLVKISLIKSILLIWSVAYTQSSSTALLCFYGTFILDKLAIVLKTILCISTFSVISYSERYNKKLGIDSGEFSILVLLSTLGMMVLISGNNLLNIFLGMELSSLAIYGLLGINKYRKKSPVTTMRYFVISALATSIILYGISLLFGITKTLYLDKTYYVVSKIIAIQKLDAGYNNFSGTIFLASMIMICAGVFLKLGVAPFHTWVTEVYEDSPTSTGMFIASAGKISIFALVIRLLFVFKSLGFEFQGLIIFIGLVSIIIGNISAISERKVKKIIALSSIANMGYMLLGIASNSQAGNDATLFYMISYILPTITVFGSILAANSINIRIKNIDDLKGLNTRSPMLSSAFLFSFLSVSGIPPFLGFFAKFYILRALVYSKFSSVALLALFFSSIGIYYSLKIINNIYCDSFKFSNVTNLITIESRFFIKTSMTLMLVLGVFPGILVGLSKMSF